jgi:UDP-2,3-diacylglucosamine pyrophosphatase LpxH
MRVVDLALRPGSRVLIPGDIHFPKHDPELLSLLCKHREAMGVTDIVLIGDTFDCFGISHHKKNAAQMATRGTVAHEASVAAPFLRKLRGQMRSARCHVLTGNHEDWWDDLVDDNPGLSGMTWDIAYAKALEGWTVHPYGTGLRVGKLLVTHGDELAGSLSKHSTHAVLANYPGQNSLYGHTHIVMQSTSISYKYGKQEKHSAWTIGHCRSNTEVMDDKVQRSWARRWEQGVAIVDIFNSGMFHVTQLRPLKQGKKSVIYFEGKHYTS